MKKIVIVKNINRYTLKMIGRHIPDSDKEKIYLVFGDLRAQARDSLAALGFKEQELPENNEQSRDEFLREYIDLIGSIGKENNTLCWWATDVASKNRFTSRITELLSHFLEIVNIARNQQFSVMLVVNPDWTILPSLKKACLKDRVELVVSGDLVMAKLFSFTASRLGSLASAMSNFAKMAIRCVYCRFVLGNKMKSLRDDSGPYYVIKTFIYNRSFSKGPGYTDSFFGKLPDILSKNRKLLIFAYILGGYRYCLNEIKKCNSPFGIIPIEYFISASDLISAFKAFIVSRVAVSEKYMLGYEVADIIRNELSRTWNGIQYYQLIHCWALKRMLKKVKADTFLLTHENNPWEKMCIAALRQVSPDTFIIGYQHTIVSHASANMFPSAYENGIMPFPDKILTVGEATKNIMERYGKFDNVPVRASCALRFEYLFDSDRIARENNENILLALEGVKGVHKLIAYALRELGGNDKYKVRIRMHPLIPWRYLQGKYGFNLEKYPNFHLSPDGPVKNDLDWSGVVLYWGSTIGLEALNLGRPIVHYTTGSILNYDPLFESSVFKWVVNEDVRLSGVLEKINSLSTEEFISGWEEARKYLKNYFFPVSEENLAEFMKAQQIVKN